MQNHSSSSPQYQTVQVETGDRWLVYQRLQELNVSCVCNFHQPLQIEITTPLAAIQVWNVVRQQTIPRRQLVTWLENCWFTSAYIY